MTRSRPDVYPRQGQGGYPAERRPARGSLVSPDALNDDGDAVLEALRTGVREGSPASRARAAVSWVQLVYGRQLQAPKDKAPAADLELDPAERRRLIGELAELEPAR